MAPAVYIAGPEVFWPDAAAVGAAKKQLCAEHGCVGLWPLDNEAGEPGEIFRANIAMLRRADAVVANLTPFRGVSADPGTVFEVGYAAALGTPVYAYTDDARDLAERVAAVWGSATHEGRRRDRDGLAIEDFGLFDNLMIPSALAGLVRGSTGPLAGFAACLRLLTGAPLPGIHARD